MVNTVIPRVQISRKATAAPELSIRGLGDVAFYAQIRPWRHRAESEAASTLVEWLEGLALVAGIEAPTGEDAAIPFVAATTPSLLQAGSGTWDPIIGVEYEVNRGRFVAYHQTTAFLKIGESSAGLNPGDALITVTGAGYRVMDNVLPTLSIDTILRGSESLGGVAISNTGAVLTFLTPGVSIKLRDRIGIEGSARIPIYRSVVATQLTPGIRWKVGLVIRF